MFRSQTIETAVVLFSMMSAAAEFAVDNGWVCECGWVFLWANNPTY